MKTMCILLKWEFHRDEASNNPTLKSISPEKHLQPMMFLFYCTSNGIALRRCKAWRTAGLWERQCEVRMTLYSDFKLTFKPVSTILKYFSVEEQGTIHLFKETNCALLKSLERQPYDIFVPYVHTLYSTVCIWCVYGVYGNKTRMLSCVSEKWQWSPFPGKQTQFMNICRINQWLFTHRIHPGSSVCTALLSK